MQLNTTVNGTQVQISLPNISQQVYDAVGRQISTALANPKTKNREAIKAAFLYCLRNSPGANASDIWHHVVYRQYCEVFNNHRPQDPKQSWVRASGDALELALEDIYCDVLWQHNITLSALISRQKKHAALADMGLQSTVGSDKLDIDLRVLHNGVQAIFGGVHIKASLAERVSDDVPCSRAMMAKGLWSPLWTLDVKSFPPPTGDLVNRGELGSDASPSEKRRYIVEHGDFDNCYSGNQRTNPSVGATPSGKCVYALDLCTQPDQFATDVIAAAKAWMAKHR